jgi:hypothetical protein
LGTKFLESHQQLLLPLLSSCSVSSNRRVLVENEKYGTGVKEKKEECGKQPHRE